MYAQQEHALAQIHGKYCEPREAFLKDLDKQLTSLATQSESNQFILMGDFNTVFQEDEAFMLLCRKHELIDIMYDRNGTRDFNTYSRGKTRIDFALISYSLSLAIIAAGYTAFAEIFHSDHRGLYLVLYEKILFGNVPDQLPQIHTRKLQSKNLHLSKKYLEVLMKHMKNQNLLVRTSNLLKSTVRDDKLAELLDQQVTLLSLASEDSLPSRFQYEYSKQLIQSKAMVKI